MCYIVYMNCSFLSINYIYYSEHLTKTFISNTNVAFQKIVTFRYSHALKIIQLKREINMRSDVKKNV